ncbi:N-acetylglucosamine-6-sulfatase-like [Hyposmocoma kahamanoa]|uniref:N-acetylglucosamine-6-sulfatase-like n=1 Tax=Hyposmocoma kahamanoa TaxID=1477025 RepID=UPI000E6D7422|nr:N-acetylglucosamine-6-sulfatase-like [Hyposmocoma kahamanoa]
MLTYLLVFSFFGAVYSNRPNFVVFLTDDQDSVLGGMTPMANVQKFIGNEGVTFTNSFTTSPICCPSRASFLTGKYVHNHRTYNNSIVGGCNGGEWRKEENTTFTNILHTKGYRTFYAGKYLNEYGNIHAGGVSHVPPGWTEWHGLVGNSVYYNYTISNDGVPTYSTDLYLTDVIRNLGISYIENQTDSTPFLMVLAPPAPHQPFTPAPRHFGRFSNITAVRHPNFNIAVNDKHWLMSMPPSPLPETMMPELDRVYRSRWETLLSVDDMVADIINALDTQSLLDNTYIIYTSDNGYHIGQFSQVYDKRQPYETDIRVPLLMRGPKIIRNTTNEQPTLNIDLAPTILELAGVVVPETMDGRPIVLNNGNNEIQERTMLIEYRGEGKDGTVDKRCAWYYDRDNLAQCHVDYECKCQDSHNNTYACLRHLTTRVNMKYCFFSDNDFFTEMYDLNEDPFELHNKVNEVFPAVKHWYQLIMAHLLGCKGAKECSNPLLYYEGELINYV